MDLDYLSYLPMELVELIFHFSSPESHHNIRRTCPSLYAKTLRSFGLKYLPHSTWNLDQTTAAIFDFLNLPEVVTRLSSLVLRAPTRAPIERNVPIPQDKNIWNAKSIDPAEVAKAISRFSQLTQLVLVQFQHPYLSDSEVRTFGRLFSKHLMVQSLGTLCLTHVHATPRDMTRLIANHGTTLTSLQFRHLNLICTRPDVYGRPPLYHSPWSDLLLAIGRELDHGCRIYIECPRADGEPARLLPRWMATGGHFHALNCGLCISGIISYTDEWFEDDQIIYTQGDVCYRNQRVAVHGNKWRTAIRMLSAFNLVSILYRYEKSLDETGLEEDWMAGLERDANDELWQTINNQLLNEKEQRMMRIRASRDDVAEILGNGSVLSQLFSSS
ncbi:hypothetical protein E2P81_ATG06696 [Venturia nashicola]|uniref:F-box domain-containing protein n=1 Tax=Venturia nashicola TaxID=86259 RepID=A0A4Z1PCN1_9PEZI|nr:hypothetical protein E6O75_ATG06867 [Venturia nashicola]TLD30043.1 hypothetical protein E2P81_ATG06696 [Venturia nashicola]